MWIRKAFRDLCKHVDSPMPTQVVSNEEFIPRPQTDHQKAVEQLIGVMSDEFATELGMDRRHVMAGSDARRRFAGKRRLVSFENVDEQGQATRAPYEGGRIVYDEHGSMSAQLMRSARKPVSTPSTQPERGAAYQTYVAYYASYEMDEAKGTVTHLVQGSLNPNWVGTPLVRWYKFSEDGNRLMLSIKNGERVTGTITWEA